MAHGKALELRGIRSRVATSHWTKRHTGHDDHGRPTFETRQATRFYREERGGTSEDREGTHMSSNREALERAIMRQGYSGVTRRDISPKPRARLRHEARRDRR